MVEIAEIRDEKTFRAWLDQKDLPQEAMVALAYRAAMRVLPVWWSGVETADRARAHELTPLPVCRVLLTSGTCACAEDPDVKGRLADDAAAFAVWAAQREDCAAGADVPRLMAAPLWHAAERPLDETWQPLRAKYPPGGDHPWAFWIDWYQPALDGTETRWDLLRRIAQIGDAIWQAGPDAVAAEIARLQGGARTLLSQAYPVDFTFDALQRVMRMVGIDDDTVHLRDPAVVQAFLDDCEELRDTLRNFNDFVFDLKAGGNFAAVLHRAANKVPDELQRTEDGTHLRARHLVRLCGRIEAFSKQEKARADLGETLSGMADDALSLMRSVTRKHFGPSHTALAPLAELSLDHVDQDAVVAL
ncbi:MAG TPA: hypothetical protein ENN83_05615, partial [Rhodovulum sp.]|nr:hypothetical protein [Rhodovulum sp.]